MELIFAMPKKPVKAETMSFRIVEKFERQDLLEKETRRTNQIIHDFILPNHPFLTTHSPHGGKNPIISKYFSKSCPTRIGGCSDVHRNY
ncbi:hypothetical protein [Planococcus salinus]|uniref:Uncharacterized protein n=1 Tax=Planococcus salinus TaxID=1848460 RepID=A0A3M8PAT0_9BACL|nr:hypothetical protein [Planococcus salinus]RNF40294.1 hypothetical protein EEX84_06585 [Planococcus salinus]